MNAMRPSGFKTRIISATAISGRGANMWPNWLSTTSNVLMEAEASRQLKAFLARVSRGRPWVTLKVAATLDGKTALANGQSKWITSEDARRDVHRLRREACAVMTGIGTLLADDPDLTVRDLECERQPLRVLLDSRLDVPDGAKILRGGNVLIATAADKPDRERALIAAGAEVIRVPVESAKGKVDLEKMMQLFAARGLNHIMVETGAKLNASLLSASVVDEIVAYIAPSIFGDGARGLFALPEMKSLGERVQLKITDVRQIGIDLRVTACVSRPFPASLKGFPAVTAGTQV